MLIFLKKNFKKTSKKVLNIYPQCCSALCFEVYLKKQYPTFTTWKNFVRQSDECVIMASGPSVLKQQEALQSYAHKADFITLNSFVDLYGFLGKHQVMHVLADPSFFPPSPELQHLVNKIKSITVPLILAVPHHFYHIAKENFPLSQQGTYISFPVNKNTYALPNSVHYPLASKGLMGFGAQSVPVPALYMAIAKGYKKIWLAGCDATFAYPTANKHCQTYFRYDQIFLESKNYELPSSMQQEYASVARYFEEMENLVYYAQHNNAAVINLSLESILDMFPKGILGEKPYEYKGKSNYPC